MGCTLSGSPGIDLGIQAEVYAYSDCDRLEPDPLDAGERPQVVLVGYSLGNTTATYLQQHFETDLLSAIAESTLWHESSDRPAEHQALGSMVRT